MEADAKTVKVYLPNNKYLITLDKNNLEFKSNNLYLILSKIECIEAGFLRYIKLVDNISKKVENTFSGNAPTKNEPTFLYKYKDKSFYIPKNSLASIKMIERLEYEAHKLMNLKYLRCAN